MHPYGKEWLLHNKLYLLTVLFCILSKGAKSNVHSAISHLAGRFGGLIWKKPYLTGWDCITIQNIFKLLVVRCFSIIWWNTAAISLKYISNYCLLINDNDTIKQSMHLKQNRKSNVQRKKRCVWCTVYSVYASFYYLLNSRWLLYNPPMSISNFCYMWAQRAYWLFHFYF